MELSDQTIIETKGRYENGLNSLPSNACFHKRQIIKEKISDIDVKYHLWKDKKINDDAIFACFESIKDWLEGLEFTNRKRELETIINPFSPPVYQFISAPMGYGKTRLLEMAQIGLKKRNWRCVSLTLTRGRSYPIKVFTQELLNQLKGPLDEQVECNQKLASVSDCGRCMGISIVKFFKKPKAEQKQKICILIDQAELLESFDEDENSLIEELFETFMPKMSEVITASNPNIQWRFIFSGRYISRWEHQIDRSNLSAISHELKLFDPETIAETIWEYAKEVRKNPTRQKMREIAFFTLYFSGGYPKCMVPIIKEGLDAQAIETIKANEKKYYKDLIFPVIEDIKAHTVSIYQTAETLSVVRKISRTLLDEFRQKGLISGYRSKFDVEEKLLGTFLFQRKDNFLEDAIIRKILSIHLRHSNIDHFDQICRTAIACYLKELADPQSLEPSILAVELLFLELQAFCLKDYRKKEAKTYFEQKFNEILALIKTQRSKNELEIIEGIRELFKKDQELKLNLEYLAGAHIKHFITLMDNIIKRSKS